MADSRIGIAFQTERLALIQEIARNLVGESPPATGTSSTGRVSDTAEADVAGSDDPLLADLPGRARTPQGVASLLAGMKPPQATFAQPDDYRQAFADFAKSEPVVATMTASTDLREAPATAGVVSLPAQAAEAASGTDRTRAESISSETDTEIPSPPGLRRESESVVPARIVGATIPAAVAASAEALASDMLASAEVLASDALASTEAVVERALLSLGLGDGAANPMAMRAELGGIIASFILNAHFLPGWPPLRPVQDPEAKAFVAQLAKDPKLSKDDIAMLTYLANFGLNRTQLARILKLAASAASRSKLLESLAQLIANISTVLRAVHAEIEALAEEIEDARAGRSGRERLTLR